MTYKTSRSGAKRPILTLVAAVALSYSLRYSTAYGFHLSMVASRPPRNSFGPLLGQGSFFPGKGLSSGLISQLAVVALKVRLADHQDVTCDVTSSSSDLVLKGRVGPVTVKGKGWRSGRGLTCRAIEATVDKCDLDIPRIISRQKLHLVTPAKGKAMIALDSTDFGNFLTHRLMKPPRISVSNGSTSEKASQIEFVKEGTNIDPATKAVDFFANYAGNRWQCRLQRSTMEQRRALITVLPLEAQEDDAQCKQLQESLSEFFNEMVFELDGTFLSFRDLMVTDKGSSPSVMLALNILVRKFPSPGIDF